MFVQAAGFVRFIPVHRPTGKMQFECLRKDIQHQDRLAVGVFHLFRHFTIDGTGKRGVRKDCLEKVGEGLLQVFEREFAQDTSKRDGVRNVPVVLVALKSQELFELGEV